MELKVTSFETSDIPAVRRFNQRFRDAASEFSFPENNISPLYSKDPNTKLFFEYYLVKDENGEVRGGYYFKNQEFYLNNALSEIVFMRMPLSEGVINRQYKDAGSLIFRDMEQKRKVVFALGMGGFQYPLPKKLISLGWYMYEVPFFFHIVNQGAFLNDFEYLKKFKRTPLRKFLFFLIKIFGILYFLTALKKLQSSVHKLFRNSTFAGIKTEIIEEFTSFADELWENHKDEYSIIAKRDSHVLNKLYPKTDARFHKLKITRRGKTVGWTVLLCTKMQQDKYFGNLHLGSVIDAFSKSEDAGLLLHESVKFLRKMKADLIVSNHANINWGRHYRQNGFLKGPSNFILASSRGLKDFFRGDVDFKNSFLMRGDGDGPINL